MARPLRIELAGGLYHITARGNRREAIYLDEADRSGWLTLLGETCERYHWQCHAWCQMTNHYHLVLETADANLGQGMRHLNSVYSARFNRAHGHVGHLFQGRYHAILVEREAYFLELCRYVVLNPVRAGIVRHPAAWRWSSYRATMGLSLLPVWLQADLLLEQFGTERRCARERYARFVAAGITAPPLWHALRDGMYLGSQAFVDAMKGALAKNDTLSEVPRLQRRPSPLSLCEYASGAATRDEAIRVAYRSGGYTMQAIAAHFGVHYSTVSRAVRGCKI
jgi:putative transposase